MQQNDSLADGSADPMRFQLNPTSRTGLPSGPRKLAPIHPQPHGRRRQRRPGRAASRRRAGDELSWGAAAVEGGRRREASAGNAVSGRQRCGLFIYDCGFQSMFLSEPAVLGTPAAASDGLKDQYWHRGESAPQSAQQPAASVALVSE